MKDVEPQLSIVSHHLIDAIAQVVKYQTEVLVFDDVDSAQYNRVEDYVRIPVRELVKEKLRGTIQQ